MSSSNDYPIVGYRFMVMIFSVGLPNSVDLRFKEVSGLKMARSVNRESSMTTLAPELPQQTLTLKRGVMASIDSLQSTLLTEAEFWGTRMLRKDLMISVLDENNTPTKSWMVKNAYLSSWSWDGISGDSNDVLIESMEFSYNDITYMPE